MKWTCSRRNKGVFLQGLWNSVAGIFTTKTIWISWTFLIFTFPKVWMIIDLNECAGTNFGTTTRLKRMNSFSEGLLWRAVWGVRIAELDAVDLTKERKITMLLRAWNRCKAWVSNQSQVVIMFCTWPKVQFRLQIRIFCVWSVLLYFPRCLFGSFLKKLRWYHCKPRINRVFQRRVIFCFFATWGHHLWTLIITKDL